MADYSLHLDDLFFPKPSFNEWAAAYSMPATFKLDTTGGNKSMATTVQAKDIKKGDVINVVFESQTVSAVSEEKGQILIETRNGKTVWATTNGNAPTRFEMVKAAKPKPSYWPPKKDDVWVQNDGYGYTTVYHTDSSGKFHYGGFTNKYHPETDILECMDKGTSLKLVYRTGVTL